MASAVIKKRFTADEYHRMAEVGILSERDRVELIDGEIIVMAPIGSRHAACVNKANQTLVRAVGDHAIVQPQGPVRLDQYYEPEPDLVLLRPRADFYSSRHGGPEDVLLIIEIADSSLEYDRDVKAPIYAAARIPEYWLADLHANVVWRYLAPQRGRYQSLEPYRGGQSITPLLVPSCEIAVDALLIE
jgi:Uma2 family endonuclease